MQNSDFGSPNKNSSFFHPSHSVSLDLRHSVYVYRQATSDRDENVEKKAIFIL